MAESGMSGRMFERKSLTRRAIREIQNRDVPHGRRVPRRAAQSGSESPCVRVGVGLACVSGLNRIVSEEEKNASVV